jgi:mannose-6-phosphate isomerase-like protein (cupin superfamily)
MEVIVRENCQKYVAPDQAVAQEIVSPRISRARKHSIAFIDIPAGVRVDPHRHIECEEVYYINAGTGLMYLDGETRQLVPGDTVVILPGEVHSIKNESQENLEMIVTCVPPWNPEDQVFVEVADF